MPIIGPVITPDSLSSSANNRSIGPGKSKVVTQNIQTAGNFSQPYTPANFTPMTMTASGQADTGQLIIQTDAATAAVVITLPSAYYAKGQFIHIIKIDSTANQVSLAALSGDVVVKPAAKAWPVAQYETITVVAQTSTTGTGIWFVLQ
jgi:hypothetical protein